MYHFSFRKFHGKVQLKNNNLKKDKIQVDANSEKRLNLISLSNSLVIK